MDTWLIILIVVLVMSALMIGLGLLFNYKSPLKINYFIGYRTPMAMKNHETWMFANSLMGKLIWRSGAILLVGSLAALFPVIKASETTIRIVGIAIIIVHAAMLFGSIIITEVALRKNFDRNGNRK